MAAPEPEELSRALLNNDIAKAAFGHPIKVEAPSSRPLVALLSALSFVALSLACVVPVALLVGLLWQGWLHRSVGQLALGAILFLICGLLARSLFKARAETKKP